MKPKGKPPAAPDDAHRAKLAKAYPELAPGSRLLYVAGEDGSFYMIPESELKRCHRVADDDPNKEVLEASLAMGVIHSSSASAREARPGFFACCTTGTTGFTTVAGGWTHFVNLGHGPQVAPPDAKDDCGESGEPPADAPKTKGKPKA